MDIGGINSNMLSALSSLNNAAPASMVEAVSLKMLDNSISSSEQTGAALTKMMENSVTPYLGGNFDMSI